MSEIIVEEYQDNVQVSGWSNEKRDVSSFKIIGISDSGKKVLLDDISYRGYDGSTLQRNVTKKDALGKADKYRELLDDRVYVNHKVFKACVEKKFVEVN